MLGLTTDINTGDLLLDGGAAVLTDNEGQLAETVIVAVRGELKELPLIGAEVRLRLNGEPDVMWAAETKKMLKACGVDAKKVSVRDDGTITVE